MKTLNIKSDEALEVSLNGEGLNTDLSDPYIPVWALNEFNSILNVLRTSGGQEIHIEKDAFQYFVHCRIGSDCVVMNMEEPSVFTQLDQFVTQYTASKVAVESATDEETPVE